ncbi:hypothetical protein C5167_034742 [Papaver somniferum]|uniref:Uncharacterized protein n=1 Tax=Papaver somniferum TaxID=3469 RepID=A0A4Y7KGQ0_PAPSO|nr:hypothetical protein C5167_034742 [Papaver somniferum]
MEDLGRNPFHPTGGNTKSPKKKCLESDSEPILTTCSTIKLQQTHFLCIAFPPFKPPSFLSPKSTITTSFLSQSTMANPSNEMSTKPNITHVIFDMDGLLLDTEKFYEEVQEITLAGYGKTFDWSLKAKMTGKKAIEAAKMFIEENGIKLMPGASRLINHLEEHGVPIAVATGYVVMVPDSRLDGSYQAAADQVLSSLLDFNPSDWGLPSFKDAAN